jgi:hypothetical protein
MPKKPPPDESLPKALRWLLVRLLDLGRSFVEGGVKSSCSGFGAVLDDEWKAAGSVLILQPWSSSLCEPRWQRRRFGRLLVSRIVARNDRTRTLTGILTSWSRGGVRRSGGEFTSTRWRGIN